MLTATVIGVWNGAGLSGGCGSHSYSGVATNTIQAIIVGLRDGGATVTGNNPWNVDTHEADVMLRGTWNASSKTLNVEVTGSAFYASCDRVWSEVDSKLKKIIAANPPSAPISTGTAIAPALESLAREVVEKSATNGAAVTNVVNIFRLITSEEDRNTVALRANVLAAVLAPAKIASVQASLAQARVLSPLAPATVSTFPTPGASPGLSRNAKIGIGAAVAGAAVLTFFVGRAVGTMRP